MPLSTTLARSHRPVLVDLMLMDEMDMRNGYGHRIWVEWGTPNAEGIFEPTLHTEDDGKVLIDRDVLAELERRAGGL